MPDLSHAAVHQFWKEYDDPYLYRVIAFMEGVEDWTSDGEPAIEEALQQLGTALDDLGNIELQQEDDMIQLVASLKTGRGLRLLMALDMAYPGAAAKVLMHAEKETKNEKDTAGVFLKRNVIFERLRLMGRIFSAERRELIQKALEDTGYD
ncbi:MAG: phosphoesterase [Coxiellaceae bacterium]|nr:phosphoesterase [Coxiellaceae bacterium]|tara:strand:- start:11346 stop:11798 length:453 start_codon:yes stop_codon:yes gene_type:complete